MVTSRIQNVFIFSCLHNKVDTLLMDIIAAFFNLDTHCIVLNEIIASNEIALYLILETV
jgi:hypothetical protein